LHSPENSFDYDKAIAEALDNAERYKNSPFGEDEAARAKSLQEEKEAIEKGLPLASAE
jgi:hypothetical protein